MATGGLYGSSGTGALIAQPGSESSGLYGNSTSFGGTYFEWFIFQTSETQPATPTGGTWNFITNANTPPTGWSSTPPSNPLNTVWVSIAIVNSKNTAPLVWSVPGKFAFSSGLPILSGNGVPASGDGQSDQLYIQLDTTPQTIWFKETGTWTRLTGPTLYADLTSNQTIAGTKTFSNQIQGSISGTASNVTGTVAISNGGTGATTAASARAALGAAELGANADITSMTGVTGGISTPDFVQFDTGITPTVGVGKLQWDPTHGCMQVGLVGGNVNLQIGEETVAYVYNNTGSTITEGQVVRVVGSQGQRLTVALAQADGDPNSATILGMATENIANNSSGFITTQGVVNNLNTNGFADGTLLYLSPTVPGGVTATKPVAPQHLVWIGYVVKGNSGGAGSIYIHTQNGYELDELHNVKITDPVADNSFLVYDATLEVWQNEAPSAARTSLELGSAAVLNAGVANGVATLDAGGTVPLSQIPASIQGGVSYQGTWNATTNTPTLTSSVGTKGYYYVVSVAGSTNLNGITSWNIGDWAIYNGTAWEKIDNTDAVTSVNGYTGTVVLNYADVGAPSTTGVNATGTWGINVTGNAATATTATNVSGGTASVTTLTTSSTVTLNGGTANGVAYLNGSKVLTTGSGLTFNGTNLQFASGSGLFTNTSDGSDTATLAIGGGGANSSARGSVIEFYGNENASAGVLDITSGNVANSYVRIQGRSSTSYVRFDINASEQMRLTSTGLGIGTSSPTNVKLQLNNAGTDTIGTGNLGFAGGSSPLWVWRLGATNSDLNLDRYSGSWQSTPALTVKRDTGNVGIGTSSPTFASGTGLQVKGAGFTSVRVTAGAYTGLDISQTNSTGDAYVYLRDNAPLIFGTNNTERMRLDSSGNVGIGTSAPVAKLDVQGILAVSNGAASYWGFDRDNSTGSLTIADSGTQRLELTISGNLGLGVTPSAWATYKAFSVGNSGNSVAGTGTEIHLTANCYFNSGWKYNSTERAARFSVGENYNDFKWYTAPSGTAGNAISFSQAMTLTAAGNLGIGTSSPSAKVSVQNPNIGDTGISLQRTGSARFDIVTGVAAVTGDALQINDSAANNYLTLRSGNVGIGTSSPSTRLHAKGSGGTIATFERDASGTIAYFNRNAGSGNAGAIIGADSVAGYFAGGNSTSNMVYLDSVNNLAQFFTNGSERARIDSSGNLLVGTTNNDPYGISSGAAYKPTKVQVASNVNTDVLGIYKNGFTGTYVSFYYNSSTSGSASAGTNTGNITTNGTSTTYATSSDYRLKEDVQPMTGALAKVAALKPVTYKWKSSGEADQGFIAHELAEVVPGCVTGEKDAVDAEGNPVYQGIDTSFLVATLTAAIQEQQAIIESLKARLDAANL